jgi:hypothetical protein
VDEMSNRFVNLKKPHIRKQNGRWICGIVLEYVGDSAKNAYLAWKQENTDKLLYLQKNNRTYNEIHL